MTGEKEFIQLFLDEGSQLVIAKGLKVVPKGKTVGNASREMLREMFWEYWVPHHGLPTVLRCDPDAALMGKAS